MKLRVMAVCLSAIAFQLLSVGCGGSDEPVRHGNAAGDTQRASHGMQAKSGRRARVTVKGGLVARPNGSDARCDGAGITCADEGARAGKSR